MSRKSASLSLAVIVETMRRHNLPTPVAIHTLEGPLPTSIHFSNNDVAAVDAWRRFIDNDGSVATEINDWVSYAVTGQIGKHSVKAWCAVTRDEEGTVS